MSKQPSEQITADIQSDAQQKRTCFIIMPISDHPRYEPGHFDRVYEFIIKPACELSGFRPIRADEVRTTNVIAMDIVKKIVDSDMAICDLSSQNPNVMYEVGIRQAFNKPVTFIKDELTDRIFDTQHFRDVPYESTLRIDTVNSAVQLLAETVVNTFEKQDEINSLVTLIGMEPAEKRQTTISVETRLILDSLQSFDSRISGLEKRAQGRPIARASITLTEELKSLSGFYQPLTPSEMIELNRGEEVYSKNFGRGKVISVYSGDTTSLVEVFFEEHGIKDIMVASNMLYKIT